MKKKLRVIAYQKRVVEEIEKILKSQSNRLYIPERDKKSPLARVQIGTGGGKTTTMGLSINHCYNKSKNKNIVFLVLVPSTNNLPEQITNGLIGVVGNIPLCNTNTILADGKLLSSCIYVIGWSKIDKKSNKLKLDSDLDESLMRYIEEAKNSGNEVRVYVDESHLERDNVNYLRNNLNVDAFIEFSATLDNSVAIITKDESSSKGYYNTVMVERQELIDAGLVVENISINPFKDKSLSLLHKVFPGRDSFSDWEFSLASTVYTMNYLNNGIDRINSSYKLIHDGEYVTLPNVCVLFSIPHDTDLSDEIESINKIKRYLIDNFKVNEEEIAVYTAREKTNNGVIITPSDIVTNNKIHYVITKDALQVGFDCPRCVCITKLKEKNGSWSFEVQLLGRTLRTLLGYSYKCLNVVPLGLDRENELKYFNSFMEELYTSYVFTNNESLKRELTKIYGKQSVTDETELGRYGEVDNQPDFNISDIEIKALSILPVCQHKVDTSYVSSNNWTFDLSLLTNSIIDYIYSSDNRFEIIDSNYDLKKSLDNQKLLKNNYNFDFEVETCITSGDIKDLDSGKYNSITNEKINTVYKSTETSEMDATFVNIAKYLNISHDSFMKILEHMFSSLHILSDGECRLLSLSESAFRNLLYRNHKQIEKLFLGKAYCVYKELYENNNKLDTISSNSYSFDLMNKAFRPYYYKDDKDVVDKRERKNHIFNGVYSDARTSKNAPIIAEELKFEDFIEKFNPENIHYMHNLDKNKPGFCVPYKVFKSISHKDGYLLGSETSITITQLNNFYPDYVVVDLDDNQKVIYISFLEIKHPVSVLQNSSPYDERVLPEKFLGLYDYLHTTRLMNVVDNLGHEYEIKLSGAIVRRDDTSNKELYKLCLLDNKYNANYVNSVDSFHWKTVKNVYELQKILRNSSI